MVIFDLWTESLVFTLVYATLVVVPCLFVGFMGRNLINRLGQYPSKTPSIQLSVFFKLVTVEVISFVCLIGFYHVFAS